MSGVAVIRYLLAQNGPVIAVVPAAQIMGGDLPINTTLPALSVKEISSTQRLTVGMVEMHPLHTERVQVTVVMKGQEGSPAGGGYPGVKALLKLVLAACANTRGTINTVNVDSIVPDVEGPDLFDDEEAVYTQSRDFLVRYHD